MKSQVVVSSGKSRKITRGIERCHTSVKGVRWCLLGVLRCTLVWLNVHAMGAFLRLFDCIGANTESQLETLIRLSI